MSSATNSPAAALDSAAAATATNRHWLLERVAAGHVSLALIATAALAIVVTHWPAVQAGGQPLECAGAASAVAWSMLAYAIAAGAAELNAGLTLRRTGLASASQNGWRTGAHALVLIATVTALGRGLHSLGLLAGLDGVMGAMLVLSGMGTVIGLLDGWRLNRDPVTRVHHATRPDTVMWLSCQWAAALFFAVTLLYLERLPLPHDRPSRQAANSSADLPGDAADAELPTQNAAT